GGGRGTTKWVGGGGRRPPGGNRGPRRGGGGGGGGCGAGGAGKRRARVLKPPQMSMRYRPLAYLSACGAPRGASVSPQGDTSPRFALFGAPSPCMPCGRSPAGVLVMPGLVPASNRAGDPSASQLDGRDKPGHDEGEETYAGEEPGGWVG